MATLVTTITETLRYRGKLGQWSWVFHRLSGLGIVLFLALHVIDTSWAAFYPHLYEEAIANYQSPLFTLGEFGLVAAVIYHAINGYRIIYLDYRPQLWHLQQKAALMVFGIVGVILIPVFVLMFGHVQEFYGEENHVRGLQDVIASQVQFVVGFAVIVGVALVLSLIYALINGENLNDNVLRSNRPSSIDAWFWKFMRVSGLLILPLVFGHLAIVHVLQGVFDITKADLTVMGTNSVNESGSAVEYVGRRWDYLVAGVRVWRFYDGALLALTVVHGFYGLSIVVNDFIHKKVVARAVNWAIVFGALSLILVGSAALMAGVEETAYAMVQEALR